MKKGFTLVEMLIVIAVIALLASLIFPITRTVAQARIRNRAKTELSQVETAIDSYKARLGFYPPVDSSSVATNVLYYELAGTTYDEASKTYTTLDRTASITTNDIPKVFGNGIGGFQNCTRGGGGDEAQSAMPFIKDFKDWQHPRVTNNGVASVLLGTLIDGPVTIPTYTGSKLNPWCYNSANPTNNPNSYDLWLDVMIGGATNRICNWSAKPIILK